MSYDNPQYATYDINDDGDYGQSKYINKVFKTDDAGKPLYEATIPKAPSSWLIMPGHVLNFTDARGKAPDPLAVAPYRRPDHSFGAWLTGAPIYGFFGPERNYTLLSPKIFGQDVLDPMVLLVDAAGSSPEFYDLAGLGADGKKNTRDKDAYKRAILGVASEMRFINAIGMDAHDANSGKARLLMCRKSVFGSPKTKGWGLIDQLQQKLPTRAQQTFTGSNWGDVYNVGDPTDPANAARLEIFKDTPPNGGLAQFNGKIVIEPNGEPEAGYTISEELLRARVFLGDIFQYTDPNDLVTLMFELFSAFPDLLRRAFQNRVRNTEERLSKGQATGDPRALTDRPVPTSEPVTTTASTAPVRRSVPTAAPETPAASAAPARRAPEAAAAHTAPAQAAATNRPAQFAPRRAVPAADSTQGAPAATVTQQPRSAAQTEEAAQSILAKLQEEEVQTADV